jgi:Trk-type K+ transport system membrane component
MAIVLIALLIVLILGGLGFAIHVLWWIAIVALIIWLLGFLLRAGETSARPRRRRRRRWYHW